MDEIVYYNCTDDKEHSAGQKKMTPREREAFKKRNYRLTIVGILTPQNVIKIGMAACCGKDNFSKKKGKKIASDRLKSRPITLGSLLDIAGKKPNEIRSMAIKYIKTHSNQVRKKLAEKRKHETAAEIVYGS